MARASASSVQPLSGAAKAAVAAMVVASAASAVWFFRNDLRAMLIALGGMVAVLLLLVIYRWVLGRVRRRKARPMERAILTNTAAAPRGVSAPARRAALDDLRKKFTNGVEKFRAAGKDLYTLPWYVLVGEPGGGKTEAIRHCNVGFPPGLQEYTQGAGGTINMNWWFTNHAIILDTAGRLMFEEVPAGSTSEWQEFLKLLTRARPNCPINGMLLVIPADTLIKDTADAIERKAGRIAEQLDEIQRLLGVRFPVFVIVTKCDLINGFREFFEGINDPQLQHQMLGWSNPAPLDKPFTPEQIDKHLNTVRQRLVRRRNLLMLDPVHTDDPNLRRIDQVDALFSFPDSFANLMPRLRRYLELIFAASEWSPKPLFLRGIYFTSSMREGQVLDKELADALGVPIESLKEDGKMWERERAYFLRDLFMAKVFREKGLVTRSSNTRKLQRRRKLLVATAGLAGVAALFFLTWTGAKQLHQSVGRQANYWMAVSADWSDRHPQWQIVRPAGEGRWVYNGTMDLNLGDQKTTLGEFFTDAPERVNDKIEVPLVFRPQVIVRGDLNERQRQAYRQLYEAAVLESLVTAARAKLAQETADTWTPQATDALGQLYRLEVEKAGLTPGSKGLKSTESLLSLDRLFKYVLTDEDYKKYKAQPRQALQDMLVWTYADQKSAWPPASLGAGTDAAQKILRDATGTFTAFAQTLARGRNDRLKDIAALRDKLEQFRKAEEAVWAAAGLAGAGPTTVAEYTKLKDAFLASEKDVQAAGQTVEAAVKRLEADWPADMTLLDLYQRENDRAVTAAWRAHDVLLEQVPADTANLPSFLVTQRKVLTDSVDQVQQQRQPVTEGLENDLLRMDRLFLSKVTGLDDQPARRYRLHLRLYDLGAKQLTGGGGATTQGLAAAGEALQAMQKQADTIRKSLDELKSEPGPAGDRLQSAVKAVRAVVDWSLRNGRYHAMSGALDTLPQKPEDLAALVKEAASHVEPVKRPAILFTELEAGGTFDPHYHPAAMRAVLVVWTQMDQLLTGGQGQVLESAKLRERFQASQAAPKKYAQEYLAYWTADVPGMVKVKIDSWQGFFRKGQAPQQWKAQEANSHLKELFVAVRGAAEALGEAGPAWRDELKVPAHAERFGAMEKTAEEPAFNDDCQRVLDAWRGLARDANLDPAAARGAVLGLKPATFVQQFLFATEPKDMLADYWSAIAIGLTRNLADESQDAARKALEADVAALRQYARFPLAPWAKDQKPLTPQDLNAARVLLEKVAQLVKPSGGGGQTIGQGAATGVAVVDDAMQDMRGLSLSEPDRQWTGRLEKMLDALPAQAGKAATVTVSVLGEEDRPRDLRTKPPPWYSMMMEPAAGKSQGEVQLQPLPRRSTPLGTMSLPGGGARFKFYQFVTHDLDKPTETAAAGEDGGEWGCLRMLQSPGAQPKDSTGKRWLVELSVKDDRLWLLLDFEKPLPKPDEWPVAPAPK